MSNVVIDDVIGAEGHEFSVWIDGKLVANIWHSDLSEWTVETPDGPVYKERNRQEAIDRAIIVGKV